MMIVACEHATSSTYLVPTVQAVVCGCGVGVDVCVQQHKKCTHTVQQICMYIILSRTGAVTGGDDGL